MNAGDYESAVRRYSSILVTGITYISDWLDSIMLLRIAECHERLGHRTVAIEYYRRFLMYWKDSEPQYRYLAEQASRRLEALLTRPI